VGRHGQVRLGPPLQVATVQKALLKHREQGMVRLRRVGVCQDGLKDVREEEVRERGTREELASLLAYYSGQDRYQIGRGRTMRDEGKEGPCHVLHV